MIKKKIKLNTLAEIIGAKIIAPPACAEDNPEIIGVATLENAKENQISFFTNPRFSAKLRESKAAAVIVSAQVADLGLLQLVSKNPYASMAKASQYFFERYHSESKQSELSFIHPSAQVAANAIIYPFAFIDEGAVIGDHVILYPHSYVGVNSIIESGSILFPGAVVMDHCHLGTQTVIHSAAVIGADGFGYAPTREGIEKIPQIGGVKLGEHCEIGSGSSVNRGAFENTVLGNGVKLDSQAHIAHGVELGDYSMLCGLAGIAGSASIGKRFIGAGQSGVAPGIEVGDHITLGPQSGLIKDTQEKGEYLGFPAVAAPQWRRQMVAFNKLPDLLKSIRALEKKLAEMESKLEKKHPG